MKSYILALCVFAGCSASQLCEMKTEDVTNMYTSYVEEWKTEAKSSFDKAEQEIFKSNPQPSPDVVGPHPDPAKCICKGTGRIVQGDGHTTPCPYHSGQQQLPIAPKKK